MASVRGQEYLSFVDYKINCSPHEDGGCTHCGSDELQELHVSPLKDVIPRDKDHSIFDGADWIVGW